MRYLSEDEAPRMMGLEYVGELYQGLDGHLYEWVEGVDEWGDAIGYWQGLSQPEGPALGGLGALYEAPDGTVYQVQGLAEEDLDGLYEAEELRGFAEDEELRGFAEDEELRGLDEDEELRGFAEDEELRGFDEDQDMQGIDGYVRQDGMSGLDAFVPQEPPQTRWHVTPAQPPEVWKRLW